MEETDHYQTDASEQTLSDLMEGKTATLLNFKETTQKDSNHHHYHVVAQEKKIIIQYNKNLESEVILI